MERLEDVVDVGREKILMEYHSILHRLTGIPMDFVSADGQCFKLCPERHLNPICRLTRASAKGRKGCDACGAAAMAEARIRGESVVRECHVGLTDISVPLFINKRFVGCVTAGQILTRKPTKKTFAAFMEKISPLGLRVPRAELERLFFATPCFDAEKLQAVVDLISLVSNYIVESTSRLLFLEKMRENDKISLMRRYVERNYKEKIGVEDAAAAVFLSPSHFSHMLKKELGTSFVQYLNRFRVDKARELLLNTALNITEVSMATGFQSVTHFNRIFRKFEGGPPATLRKSRKGK